MNAKTEQQIANLKTQTIGVEIEMNHITRKNAAKLAATRTRHTETATTLGQLGMPRDGNGNSKGTLALPELTVKSANW